MKIRFFIISVILFASLLSACSLKPVSVEGNAMLPSFHDGDKIFIDKSLNNLKRGDVITFLYPKNQTKWYFKRIIGLPGEKVEIRDGTVLINDSKIDEPYVDQNFNQSKQNTRSQIIPENQYFVLGDNRDNSSDSRAWGMLDHNLIMGKYYMTYSEAKK